MQRIVMLSGLNNVPDVKKGEILVLEDEKGKRYLIDPSEMERTEGLGFLSTIIGAGAKLVGKLIKKGPKGGSSAQGSSQGSQASSGFASRFASQFSGGGNGGGGGVTDLVKTIVDQKLSSQSAQIDSQISRLDNKTADAINKIDTEKKALEKDLTELKETARNAELLDKQKQMEADLRNQINQQLSPKEDLGKYIAIGGAILTGVLLLKNSSAPAGGLNGGIEGAGQKAKKPSKKVGTIKI